MVFYLTAVMTIGPRVIWKKTHKQPNLNIYQDQVTLEERRGERKRSVTGL